MESVFFAFEILGTVAFAASGAMVGLRRRMDVFGVVILALCTAVGGGVMRDLVLGITPPATFEQPIYAAVAAAVAVAVFLPPVRRRLAKANRVYDTAMLIMDTVGLGSFTVVGVKAAYSVADEQGIFLLIFVGVITGVGGGVMRDVLAGEVPSIFVKHFYACASLIGALTCALVWSLGQTPAMIAGAAVVVVLRFLAAHYHWELPRGGE